MALVSEVKTLGHAASPMAKLSIGKVCCAKPTFKTDGVAYQKE